MLLPCSARLRILRPHNRLFFRFGNTFCLVSENRMCYLFIQKISRTKDAPSGKPFFFFRSLMSSKHLKLSTLICGIILALFLYKPMRVQPRTYQHRDHVSEWRREANYPSPRAHAQNPLVDIQTSDFHRTIIDKNLFRPLGWRPPRPKEPYRLLGTILPTHGNPQAILQATAENKIYTVTRGDKLDTDTTITDIQAKQVTLKKAGQQRTLKLTLRPWLK